MNIEKWEQQLKVLAQLAGACVAAAYIGGFLVVSGYHAKYGILGISFVRPKILTAGVVFFVFLAIPIYELGLIYGWPVFLNALKSQLTTDTVTTPVSTRNQIISRSDRLATGIGHLLTYVASSCGIALFICLIFFRGEKIGFALLVLPSEFVAGFLVYISFNVAPRITVLRFGLLFLSFVPFGLITWWSHNETYQLLVLWFMVCGFTAYRIRDIRKEILNISKLPLHQYLLLVLLPILIFSLYLYPRIDSRIFGGAPVAVTVYCTEIPPFTNSKELSVLLVDETDAGFYFLLKSGDKKAVYLARAEIRAIKFD